MAELILVWAMIAAGFGVGWMSGVSHERDKTIAYETARLERLEARAAMAAASGEGSDDGR